MECIERGCLFVPTDRELEGLGDEDRHMEDKEKIVRRGLPSSTLGANGSTYIECLRDEHRMLRRFSSIVRTRDPDILLSWDPQSGGLGYLIERSASILPPTQQYECRQNGLDMARLLGRNPTRATKQWKDSEEGILDDFSSPNHNTKQGTKEPSRGASLHRPEWNGSGLGLDWDERVGPGAAAASIVRKQPRRLRMNHLTTYQAWETSLFCLEDCGGRGQTPELQLSSGIDVLCSQQENTIS